ncbi:hypothetical protein AZI86_03390 [Bdellovibrio bacteriovorus]|uniref:Pilus assembly protein n=1 Tax=Bdellovibrio bacteriovorus TaxID=959 RepID=A0A150WNP0_BDEBC|nr:hypothetical protein [Bdellovibrio bacteriovorus]KYG66121.1 hypothetical protein AZI86_03390 [Bdellovibrio bacteriovorus]
MKLNRKGQGLVETVLSLPLVILVVTGIVILLHRSLIFHIADYQAHEALICSQSESTHFCEQELQNRLRKILLSGSTSSALITRSLRGGNQVTVTILLNHGWKDISPPIEIKKSL